MKKIIVIIGIAVVTLISCKDKKLQATDNIKNDSFTAKINNTVNPKLKLQLTKFYLSYLKIVEFLAGDKATEAMKKAKEAINVFDKINDSKLTGSEQSKWMDFKINIVKALNDMTVKQKTEDRKASLKLLSENLASAIDVFGVKSKVYEMYCPMVKATWLSNHSEIRNPYFGSKMLHCGKVTREIKK